MMTKDMDLISNLNTGQELKFIQFFTHRHPTINLQVIRTCGIKTLDCNKDRCYSGSATFALIYSCFFASQTVYIRIKSDKLSGMIMCYALIVF